MKRIFVFLNVKQESRTFLRRAQKSNIEEMKNQVSPEEVDAQTEKLLGILLMKAHMWAGSGVYPSYNCSRWLQRSSCDF